MLLNGIPEGRHVVYLSPPPIKSEDLDNDNDSHTDAK